MFRFSLALVCLLFLLWGSPCRSVAAPVSAPIPLDSWIYPALEKLDSLCWIDSALQGMKPFTRHEAARRVALARDTAEIYEVPAVAMELLRSLEHELHVELAELVVPSGSSARGFVRPLEDLRFSYVYQDGGPSNYAGNNASQFALNYNNEGNDYREYHNLQLYWTSKVRLQRNFLLAWRPRLEFQGGANPRLQTEYGAASLALGPVTASLGRQSLWWGQGAHGSLNLTNNAEPLDMLRFNTPSPLRLPSILAALGPFRFDLFVSRLGKDRAVPEPFFSGLRLDFKPFTWLEIGATRTLMFGGQGTPDLDSGDFLTILSGKNLSGRNDTSNSIAALDARLTLPMLWGMQLYGELGGEDEANRFFSKTAFLVGLYLPQIEPSGRLDLRIEYADTTPPGGEPAVWYRHSIYRSGYTYEKKILGHHAGGDAKDLWVEMRSFLPGNLSLALNFNYEQRGETQPRQEKHYQPGLKLGWRDAGGRELSLRYAYEHVKNIDFTEKSENLQIVAVDFLYLWR